MVLIKLWTPLFLLLLLIIFRVSATSMYKTFQAEGNQLYELVQDQETQDVYVGGRNQILHLDSTLNLKQEVKVGPVQDSPRCLPNADESACKTKTLRNNNIVVLEIEPSSRYLFACGTVKQGACQRYDLTNIKNSTRFLANKAEHFVGSNNSSIAFFGLDPVSNTSILYIAMSYDGRMVEAFPKTMSERIISTSKTGHPYLSYRKYYYGIPTNKDMLSTYPVDYIYGFEHKHFLYYLSLQGNQTYIGRVCEYSEKYYYVELQLKCWNEDILWSYATAAKLVDNNLFVTYWNETKNTSWLCDHTMSEIRDEMISMIKDCANYDKTDDIKPPAWIGGKGYCAESFNEAKIDGESCGIEGNEYISGGKHVTISGLIYKGKFTAIQSYVHEGTPLYLLGTSTGHLMKVAKAKLEKGFEVLMDNDVSKGSGLPIQRDMEVNVQKTHVYAISGSTVIRFPLKTCSVYTSCSTCVTNNDPLNCGWCDGKCTNRAECSNGWSPDCCVPQITSISPTKGPVEGGTKLTIKGEYFANGNPKLTITIKVGTAPCSVNKSESNSTYIFCTTTKDTSVKMGNVHVKIKARSIAADQPKIQGEGRSKEVFYFMVPEIYNFTPTIGPMAGGTKCNITGKNLDIGSRVELYIKGHKISIEKRTPDKIFALTQSVDSEIEAPLHLRIDNEILKTKESFCFKPDPTVTEVHRLTHTIKSGGIDIVFIGTNLNTVQKPMLSGIVVKTEAPLPPEKCVPNEDGTQLSCKTPPLYNSSAGMVPVDLRLEMDGVSKLYNFGKTHPDFSRIFYYDDPTLYKFDTKQNIFFYGKTTKNVEIKGNLITDFVKKKDINIKIGDGSCLITSLKSRAILCKPSSIPEKDTDHQKFQVLVKIGYRTFNIGWVRFVSASSAGVDISIIVLIVVLICVMVVIGILFYCLWKNKLLFFKPKSMLPTARYTANDQVHFGENGRLIINSNEYTERQNFPPVQPVGATSCPVIDESILLVLGDKKLLIPKEALQITEKIGQGHFGCVYRALYRKPGEKGEMLVAVKTLHKDHPRDMDIQGFLDEALIMKDFDHDNILSLIGICLGKDHMPLVVLPYMAHGDLLSYLRNVDNQPTVKDLIIFGISIASGMDYLASLKFVHRDLAARNCMLNDKLVVKVADFGLSRDIYERDYYSSDNKKSKLPVKWMALESLENGTYNTKTDVWSYGVVLWELFTRGVNPYPTVDNWDMPKYLKLGRRMDKPDYCPNRIYDIMLCCWEFDQNLRPDFATIFKELTELSEMEKHRDLPCYQKTPYENVEY